MTCARGLSAALAARCVGLPSYHSCLYSELERAGQPIEDIVREATAPDPLEEAVGQMDELVGLFISRLSGFAARCGGRDLAARRASTKPCTICGLRFPKPRPSWRISVANLHWMPTHDDRRDDRRRSRGSDRARRPLHRATSRRDRGNGCRSCQRMRRLSTSRASADRRRRWTRCLT